MTCILIGTIYLILRNILIYTHRCLNLGGCYKLIENIHPCGFQDLMDQPSLIKMKSTII